MDDVLAGDRQHKTQVRSYLLRLWRDNPDSAAHRVLLENVLSGERRYFASLENLLAFLDDPEDEIEPRRDT